MVSMTVVYYNSLVIIILRVKNHCENSTKLKELSLLSDIIHCVHCSTDRIQSEIECTAIRIERM